VKACPEDSVCVEVDPEPFVLGKACCELSYPEVVVCLIVIQKIYCKIRFITKISCALRLIPRIFCGFRFVLKM
jgi:hypothetical protein